MYGNRCSWCWRDTGCKSKFDFQPSQSRAFCVEVRGVLKRSINGSNERICERSDSRERCLGKGTDWSVPSISLGQSNRH